jgi:hypothetical protein
MFDREVYQKAKSEKFFSALFDESQVEASNWSN